MSGSPTAALLFQKCANTSTILTHLNRGSSYLVHDVYYRFIKKDGTEAQYVNAGRLSTVGLYVFAARLSLTMSSAQQAFQILLSIGAGTGMLYMARWFWRRVSACRRVGVSAWCEIVAMVMSLLTIAFVLLRVTRQLWSDSTASQAREDARARNVESRQIGERTGRSCCFCATGRVG